MPVYICEDYQQLNALVEPLTIDHNEQIRIHFCNINHRDVYCCDEAQMLHDGTHPTIAIVYISNNLLQGAKVIINQLLEHFPDAFDYQDQNFILTCPGCGLRFAQQ